MSIDLKKVNPKRTVLFELFRPYGLAPAQVDELIKLIGSRSGQKLLTKTHCISKNRNEIIVHNMTKRPKTITGQKLLATSEKFRV